MVSGSEEFGLVINFRRYGDEFGDFRKMGFARKADEKGPNDPTEIVMQQPESFGSEPKLWRGDVESAPRDKIEVSEEVKVWTEKEFQLSELDNMEEVACKLSESMNGSVTALSILNGVLQARKIMMGEEHFKTLKTIEKLGYLYAKYSWASPGADFLKKLVEGLKKVFGERNEHTLTAMYKLAKFTCYKASYKKAWPLFKKVLEGRVEVLGRDHPETLDTIKRLEAISVAYAY
ncbi:hypothetical protein RUND412_000423 [Rhizina undulata]